ncbi:MAG: hypothetical protein ABI478_14015 [Propionivibrio sp.]
MIVPVRQRLPGDRQPSVGDALPEQAAEIAGTPVGAAESQTGNVLQAAAFGAIEVRPAEFVVLKCRFGSL